MKKQDKFLALTACVVTAMAGVNLVCGASIHAAGGSSRVYVYDANAGTTGASCDLYNSDGTSPDCDASYGSYNATTGVLTLGTGVNNKTVNIVDASNPGKSYTIKASGNITASLSTPSYATITFDLGKYSWTGTANDSINMPVYGSTVVKSGTLNFIKNFSNNSLRIDGGTVNMGKGTSELSDGSISAKVFEMNGGAIKTADGNSEITTSGEINDGDINIAYSHGLGGCLELGGVGSKLDLNGGDCCIGRKRWR